MIEQLPAPGLTADGSPPEARPLLGPTPGAQASLTALALKGLARTPALPLALEKRQLLMKAPDPSPNAREPSTAVYTGPYGPVRPRPVKPYNPRTPCRGQVRANLDYHAGRFAQLTAAQRAAWNAAAATYGAGPRHGQSAPPSGFQFFLRVNSTLAGFGLAPLDTPPPVFPELAPVDLVITHTAGEVGDGGEGRNRTDA